LVTAFAVHNALKNTDTEHLQGTQTDLEKSDTVTTLSYILIIIIIIIIREFHGDTSLKQNFRAADEADG